MFSTLKITGAAQGLGKELAMQYSEHGCTVVLLDYNEAGVQEVAADINSKRPGSAFSFKYSNIDDSNLSI